MKSKILFSAATDETTEQIKISIIKELIDQVESYEELDTLIELVKELTIVEEEKLELMVKGRLYLLVIERTHDN